MAEPKKSIAQFDGIRRFPRLGKVRCGYVEEIDVPDGRGGTRTKINLVNTPHFIVRVDDGITDSEMVGLFEQYCGKDPTEINCEFPMNDREKVFPYQMKRYGRGGKLHCFGDGETAMTSDPKDPEQMTEIKCIPDTCPYVASKDCTHVGNLFVYLLDPPGWGVWQIDIRGWNSIVRILSLMDQLEGMHAATTGRPGLVGIPFKLVKRKHQSHPWIVDKKTGEKKQITSTNYIVDYQLPQVRLTEIRAQLAQRNNNLARISWDGMSDEDAILENARFARRDAHPLAPMSDEELEDEKENLFGASPEPPPQKAIAAAPEPAPAPKPAPATEPKAKRKASTAKGDTTRYWDMVKNKLIPRKVLTDEDAAQILVDCEDDFDAAYAQVVEFAFTHLTADLDEVGRNQWLKDAGGDKAKAIDMLIKIL